MYALLLNTYVLSYIILHFYHVKVAWKVYVAVQFLKTI